MSDKKQEIKDENLKDTTGGFRGRPWGTWVPVDEECDQCNKGTECPFYPDDRHFDNCDSCMHKNGA